MNQPLSLFVSLWQRGVVDLQSLGRQFQYCKKCIPTFEKFRDKAGAGILNKPLEDTNIESVLTWYSHGECGYLLIISRVGFASIRLVRWCPFMFCGLHEAMIAAADLYATTDDYRVD